MSKTTLKLSKPFLVIAVTLVSLGARASWFQEYCSNGEGTLRIAQGHNESFIEYTIREYGPEGVRESRVRDEQGDLRWDASAEQDLVRESHQGCVPGQSFGFGSWKTVTYQRKVIRRADGQKFPKDAVGVSEDGLTLTADMICQNDGNSEILCPAP